MKIIQLTDERDAKFERLKKLGVELKVPIAETHYQILLENPGEEAILYKSRAHTWVRNYYNAMAMENFNLSGPIPDAGVGYGAGSLRPRSGGGTITANATSSIMLFQNTSTYYDIQGILIGTGDTAYAFDQYALAARIEHGTGSGQISHNTMVRVDPTYDSDDKKWTQIVSRIFNNNSGGAITIKEIAIMGSPGGTYNSGYIICRDVITPAEVQDGGQVTVTYSISLTFPA